MVTLTGKGVCAGIAIGKLCFYKRKERHLHRIEVLDVQAEIQRFWQVKQKAQEQVGALYEKTLKVAGEKNAMIFLVHQMMLEDRDYCSMVETIIREQKADAEYAVLEAAEGFARKISDIDDPYMKERAIDIRDVAGQLSDLLAGREQETLGSNGPIVLAAEELSPSDIVRLDKKRVLGVVTACGSVQSHASILAKTAGIPAVVSAGTSLNPDDEGKIVIVDGNNGRVYIDPDEDTIACMVNLQQMEYQRRQMLEPLKGLENITTDGVRIRLCANIATQPDIALAQENDADGVGLMRSEFIYLENMAPPAEEEQLEIYRFAVESFPGKRVVIRTMDLQSDKQLPYLYQTKENNPALGIRGVRFAMTYQNLLRTQLRAILQASAFGKAAIMFPMIVSEQEVRALKGILQEEMALLKKNQIPFDPEIEVGVMIETPAAALMSDRLAKEVDFFSIGTNDLTQYTLAADRQNPQMEPFYEPQHPAVLRMIAITVKNAHAAGKWVGICGELACDHTLLPLFLTLGVDELSVPPAFILSVRQYIRQMDLSKSKQKALEMIL